MNAKLACEIGRRLGMAKKAYGRTGVGLQSLGVIRPEQQTPRPAVKNTPPIEIGDAARTSAAKLPAGARELSSATASGAELPADARELSGATAGGMKLPADVRELSGATAGADTQGVHTLDPATIKQIGTPPAGAQPMSGGESQFYGDFGPKQMQDYMKRYFSRFTGFGSPAEYTGWRQAQSAGMGRALRAASNRRWLRSMFA